MTPAVIVAAVLLISLAALARHLLRRDAWLADRPPATGEWVANLRPIPQPRRQPLELLPRPSHTRDRSRP